MTLFIGGPLDNTDWRFLQLPSFLVTGRNVTLIPWCEGDRTARYLLTADEQLAYFTGYGPAFRDLRFSMPAAIVGREGRGRGMKDRV